MQRLVKQSFLKKVANWDTSEEAAAYKLQERWPSELCSKSDQKHISPPCLTETSLLFPFSEMPQVLKASELLSVLVLQ